VLWIGLVATELVISIGLIAAMGASLGLLGGGGSIVALPILLYALGIDAHEAIPLSQLVVAAAAITALVVHAPDGVRWREGLTFGAMSAAAAFASGSVAAHVPPVVVTIVLVAAMGITAVAMLRRPATAPARVPSLWRTLRDASIVGVLAGFVGAGGGFLVLPALVVLARLPMREAIATALFVIALNALGGFAAHAIHTSVDLVLAGTLSGAAAAGAVVGSLLGRRIATDGLRRGFAVLVLALAFLTVHLELPQAARDAFWVARWPFWAGGAAIGAFVLFLSYWENRLLGISTGFLDACNALTRAEARRSWRLPLLAGVVAGGALSGIAAGAPPSFEVAAFDATLSLPFAAKAALFLGGGILLGFGARAANGCTSGHGIVGVALGARSSIVATIGFMAAGFATTHLVRVVAGS
jgi:hypothetical protein